MAKLKMTFESNNPTEPNGYDGAYSQGYNFEMFRIWELEEDMTVANLLSTPRYFKQLGTMDSYGDITWHDTDMVEVEKAEKVVKVYEYK